MAALVKALGLECCMFEKASWRWQMLIYFIVSWMWIPIVWSDEGRALVGLINTITIIFSLELDFMPLYEHLVDWGSIQRVTTLNMLLCIFDEWSMCVKCPSRVSADFISLRRNMSSLLKRYVLCYGTVCMYLLLCMSECDGVCMCLLLCMSECHCVCLLLCMSEYHCVRMIGTQMCAGLM